MNLACDLAVAKGYRSPAQIARVVSESWLLRNGYCLLCEADSLVQSPANTKCTDFLCPLCSQKYELKTFRKRPVGSLVDGAYAALIDRIMSGTAPTLFLLQRDASWMVESLVAVHSSFLTPLVVEERKPLGPSAIRAGWIGCNIRLDRIGKDGEVSLIERGQVRPKDEVRNQFRRFASLSVIPAVERGWTILTLAVIRKVSKPRFDLADLYLREAEFQACYPKNQNVRAKIRQQLQELRDLGIVQFLGGGRYVLVS